MQCTLFQNRTVNNLDFHLDYLHSSILYNIICGLYPTLKLKLAFIPNTVFHSCFHQLNGRWLIFQKNGTNFKSGVEFFLNVPLTSTEGSHIFFFSLLLTVAYLNANWRSFSHTMGEELQSCICNQESQDLGFVACTQLQTHGRARQLLPMHPGTSFPFWKVPFGSLSHHNTCWVSDWLCGITRFLGILKLFEDPTISLELIQINLIFPPQLT